MWHAMRAVFWSALTASLCWVTPALGDDDEQVLFHLAHGQPIDAGQWRVNMRILVHEPPDFLGRSVAATARAALRRMAGLDDLNEAQKDIYRSRVRGFVLDGESLERVQWRFSGDASGTVYTARHGAGALHTDANGVLNAEFTVPADLAAQAFAHSGERRGWLELRAVSREHSGRGWLRLIPTEGLSVVSDIDDTLKITDIPAGKATVLNNTFFREFQPTPCLPELLRGWMASADDAAVHYVSGAPWQLYQPLADFLFQDGLYPRGDLHMKNARTNPFSSGAYKDLWPLLREGSKPVTRRQKIDTIGGLIAAFPQRRFILVGDTGEADPEVFAELLTDHAAQIDAVYVRDVVNDRVNNPARLRGMHVIEPQASADGHCRIHPPAPDSAP